MSEHRTLLSGTALNAVGLAVGVVAAYGVQILFSHTLPTGGFGIVTVAVQVAFVAAAGSRFGMDMAAVREVAIGVGAAETARLRSLVERCAVVAGGASVVVAALLVALAPLTGDNRTAVAIAAASVPLAAIANTYLGATRGLKSMGPTLWVFWIGQPVAWIAFAAVAIVLGGGTNAAVWSYDVSWLVAVIAARALWRRATADLGARPASAREVRDALRYGLPRSPSALLAQGLFWADLWVLDAYASGATVDTYAAVGRLAQVVLLFLTSLSLLFAPFAADLHARGEIELLDQLFKSATRWAVAATLPVVIVLEVAAGQALHVFGPGYTGGETALRILLGGQLVNVLTGSVGFILIMVGRTGIDLIDNLIAMALLVGLAVPLTSTYGMEGTATAAAVTLALVNLLRILQVRRLVGIQPYSRAFLPLAIPALACAAAAVAVHLLLSSSAWWLSLLATATAGLAAYLALLGPGLPPEERGELQRRARRMMKRLPR